MYYILDKTKYFLCKHGKQVNHTKFKSKGGGPGVDPGFQVRGALKRIAQSGGRREKIWGILCEKSRFYAKKSIFFPFLGGGGRAPGAPPP